jgi:sirohydrochlorin cobaltochelatase
MLEGKMTILSNDQRDFHDLDVRLRAMLPEPYQESCDNVLPLLMGSAGLKYGDDGKVAWDKIWGSFCHLAMAGGPPHKGRLLEPARKEEIDAEPETYREVVNEICRGIGMVTGLAAEQSPISGWVRMHCKSASMAEWLARAIVMENVSARSGDRWLDLPAGPHYQIHKEIKNVVTVVAKTCHYWLDHTLPGQQDVIATLFSTMESESPLVQIALFDHDFEPDIQRMLSRKMAASILERTGLRASDQMYEGWLGLSFQDVRTAIWMMRVLAVCNTLARREDTIVFVPVNSLSDSDGEIVVGAVARAHAFAVVKEMS